MPFYRRGGADSRGAGARPSGFDTTRKAEFVIIRSPENITDVDTDTEYDWDREYHPKTNKKDKPTKKVTRSLKPADNARSLVDLEDYSPRGPNRKRRRTKIDSSSNTSIVDGKVFFVGSAVSSGYSPRPAEEDSEDGDTPPRPRKVSVAAGRSPANREAGGARARADTIVCASSAGLKSAARKIKPTHQRKHKRTSSYEEKTAERVAEIAAKRAPHLVTLARINAEAEQLREQLRLKKQEREVMERVWGVVHSKEKGKIGVGKKIEKPKTIVWITDSENEGSVGISSSDEVGRKMSLLRKELQEESEGWDSLFDGSEKMLGVDSIKVDKPAVLPSAKRVSGRLRAASGAGEKSQNQGEKRKLWFEENTDGELAEQTGSEPTARFQASDSDSLFGNSGAVLAQGGRRQSSETKKSLCGPKISQQEKRGSGDSQLICEEERRRHDGQKRKYPFDENADGELAGQKGSGETPGFPVSDSDPLSDDLETHSGQENRKRFKRATDLRGKPRKGFGVHPKGTFPAQKSLRLHDEKVANKKSVEHDTTKTSDHLPNWCGLGEGVGKGHRGLAASEPGPAGASQGEVGAKPLSPRHEFGGGGDSSIQELQVDLGPEKGLERLGGGRGGRGTEDELERINEEIDLFLEKCGVDSTSLHDHQESPKGYDVDLYGPLPEMPWGKLVGVGSGGDSSTMAEPVVTNSTHMALGAPEGELELVQKQLEKDLDFMDWDKAEEEFLKLDEVLPAAEDPKNDVGLGRVEGGESVMENTARALMPQRSPPRLPLPQDIQEHGTRGKVLACLEQEKMEHRLDGPEDWVNNTPEEGDKAKIYNPVRVLNPTSNSRGRVRSRPYSMREIAEYSIASLFETYKHEIEKMEMKAIKSVGSSAARRGDRGRSRESKSQARGVGDTPEEKPKASVVPGLHSDEAYKSKAEDRKIYTLSEWSNCQKNRKREQGGSVRDVAAGSLESGEIVGKEKPKGKTGDATTGSLELTGQNKESNGFVGVDVGSPEDGEVIELEQKISGSASLKVDCAEPPDNSKRRIEAGSDQGRNFMTKVLDSEPAVSLGETAKLYRVELPDSSMGYVFAEIVSGAWSMVFMTDIRGGKHGKTRKTPPQLDFDGGLLSETGERAWESLRGTPQSISQEGAWGESPEALGLGSGGGSDGRNFQVRSPSPALKGNFEEPNWRDVEEEQQNQKSNGEKPDTQDRHADYNDWD